MIVNADVYANLIYIYIYTATEIEIKIQKVFTLQVL